LAAPVTSAPRPAVSPRARRVAKELDIDPARLQGSGSTGRVRERDVRTAAAERPPAASASPLRQTIARRLRASLHATAPVTLIAPADATNLVSLREQFKAARARGFGAIPSFTDIVVKLSALALAQHPALNSRWEDERIVCCDGIHIGIAVDTEAGLVVPVVRDVPGLGLRPLAERTHALIEKARAHRLSAEEQEGGTFTVSNLGAYGIEAFTPIINHPECAILGLGHISRQPAFFDDRIVPRERMTLSLTFDHRIVDGAPAARFLDALRRLLENPGPWLVT
jgi:pyruvate dehydrogenase E2 component (dihydrolipoamide acetyltransferase)